MAGSGRHVAGSGRHASFGSGRGTQLETGSLGFAQWATDGFCNHWLGGTGRQRSFLYPELSDHGSCMSTAISRILNETRGRNVGRGRIHRYFSQVPKRDPQNFNTCCKSHKFTMSTVLIDHHCNVTKLAAECRASKKARMDTFGLDAPGLDDASHSRPGVGC